ncbi:Queuine tRNA-ribosyltransferase-like protein [Leucoagaricus sp. SymC.cos]|nr:Queuine tRNA-ribosyltransferase-like protein [Leucoagaricus sp. SymC.cos]
MNDLNSHASGSKIATLGARLVEPNQATRCHSEDSEDDEAIFAELEAEIENDENYAMRERGLEAIKREMEKMKGLRDNQHGTYSEISDEKEVIRITAREPSCVVHFYHSNFKRCEIMDKHLTKLAPKYFHTRFFRVFVENIPWLVEKLSIKVLPCVICFVDGVSRDRLIGFEELGNNDSFDTAVLESRLLNAGVIQRPSGNTFDPVFRVTGASGGDDEVFDLDD